MPGVRTNSDQFPRKDILPASSALPKWVSDCSALFRLSIDFILKGATIVDGLDTLWIMGLKDEFKEGRDWIEENLSLKDANTEVSVFETVIRFVGGLLTCYAFTKDNMFLSKANEIASLMLPAFNTPTGIPNALINPMTGHSKNYAWASQSSSILAEAGTLHLEFSYLSDLTGDKTYKDKVINVRNILDSLSKPNGLYPNYISPKTGKFTQRTYTKYHANYHWQPPFHPIRSSTGRLSR